MQRGTTALSFAAVALALLACKKSEEAAPEASASGAEPTPTTEPEATASAEPAASASTAEAEPEATSKPATTAPTTKPTATPTASAQPTASASAKPDAAAPAPVNHTAAAQRIQNCCSAISAEASKGGTGANRYKIAAATCNQIAAQVKKGTANESAAKTLIRAQLQGLTVPGSC